MSESLELFLIEDNEDIALLMKKCLERAGHAVTTCRTAADAIIVLNQGQFDLVILDQRLPDMSGLDFLRALAEEGITTPALMVTGYGDERLAREVLHAGAQDYLVKDPGLAFLVELPKRVVEAVTRHRLQESNRLLVQALESAQDGVMITDLQGTILNVNRALEDMFGYRREELIGQTPKMFRSGVHPPELYAEMWRTILARKGWRGDIVNRCKNGELIDVSLAISPVFDDRGQMTHFVGIYRDFTERKQLERQLVQAQKMQSIGTLAGGVAHEFNNLLAGIQGYATLAIREGESKPEVTRQYLRDIVKLTERASNLTRQLLAFARKPSLTRRPSRMDELVRSTVDLVRQTLYSQVELETAGDAEAPIVLADVNQLQQVLINLAVNARDALAESASEVPPPPIVFRLRLEHLAHDLTGFPDVVPAGEYVLLEVSDQGPGMTPEVLQQAFDPFYTTKGVGQGTGLGLPVAYGIIRGHQGFVIVDTTPGKGTTVRIYLPRHEGPTLPRPGEFEPGEILEPETVEGKRILAIDDEEAVRTVIGRFLELAGHEVATVASCREAMDLLRSGEHFDLIILDLMIPGEESLSNFISLGEGAPGTPILLCTGLLQVPSQSALVAQASGILQKPFRMNELWYAVEESLLGKQAESAD